MFPGLFICPSGSDQQPDVRVRVSPAAPTDCMATSLNHPAPQEAGEGAGEEEPLLQLYIF